MAGIDPLALPLRRFVNMLYAMLLDGIYDKDDRKKVVDILDWPEVSEERSLEKADRETRASLAALGIVLTPMLPPEPASDQNEAVTGENED